MVTSACRLLGVTAASYAVCCQVFPLLGFVFHYFLSLYFVLVVGDGGGRFKVFLMKQMEHMAKEEIDIWMTESLTFSPMYQQVLPRSCELCVLTEAVGFWPVLHINLLV